MNVITYAHAVSLYPHMTFVERVSYQNRAVKAADKAAFKKYIDRGFTYLSREEALTRMEFRFQRCVGDRFTWILPLPRSVPLVRMPREDLVFSNSWGMSALQSSFMFDYELIRNKRKPETSVCFAEGKRRALERHRRGHGLKTM